MSQVNDFIRRLDACPLGRLGWVEYEDLCTEILDFLFVPPLNSSQRQGRTYSGINRRDAIMSNRNIIPTDNILAKNWYHLFIELDARMILFEFKNYDTGDITHEEVNQTRNYMNEAMGRLAIMICSKDPVESAHRQRNVVFNQDRRVILFLTKEHLKEMLAMKERGEQPSDLILDLVERFYIQHE